MAPSIVKQIRETTGHQKTLLKCNYQTDQVHITQPATTNPIVIQDFRNHIISTVQEKETMQNTICSSMLSHAKFYAHMNWNKSTDAHPIKTQEEKK